MRLQRSPSFESAVKIIEARKAQEESHLKEADDFYKSEGGRLYRIPFSYQNSQGRQEGVVKAKVKQSKVEINVIPERGDKGPGPLVLHWGVAEKEPGEWTLPNQETISALESGEAHGKAVESKFKTEVGTVEQSIKFELRGSLPPSISFVLKDTSNGAWYKADNHDFCVPITEEATVAREIFDFEKQGHVTLMHRYHMACSLIDRAPPGEAGRDILYFVFIWLRFSQIRQLSWQRNYNTKPRELSHASEQLNKLISWRWKNSGPIEREIFRLMLGCIGRGGSGGDGQAIRDEILHIMHRHRLPESKGTFVEEWHQKLHNNSTPDDIIICQAYLAFLHSNGNLAEFWRVIHENGLNRERLKGYERAIVTEPQFFGDKKDGLINDFNNYLRILKNVHAGADLEKCVEVCRGFLEGHINVLLESILRERGANEARTPAVIDSITEVRQLIGVKMTKEGDIMKLRDLLYLDLGLEAQLRLMAERSLGSLDSVELNTGARALTLWVGLALENLVYSSSPAKGTLDPNVQDSHANELKACLRDWVQLEEEVHKGMTQGWPTKAMAVVERMRRAMGDYVDGIQNNMQKRAEYLGYGLCAVTPEKIPEKWSITLFSEELVRGGGCSFVLSSFLRKLDKVLRKLGGGTMWQVISTGKPGAVGQLVEVHDLMSVQSETYSKPTVLLANSLSGEEEVPPGVVGVITPDAPDVLAHISVRARNLKVLFASCFDPDEFDNLGKLVGKTVSCQISGNRVTVTETGDVASGDDMNQLNEGLKNLKLELPPPAKFTSFCLPEASIDVKASPKTFGAKSTNIVAVRKLLPDWIQTPRSAVVPFGVFEKVMSCPENKEISKAYNAIIDKELKETKDPHGVLRRLKDLTLSLSAPNDLVTQLKSSLEKSGIITSGELEGKEWDEAFMALKGVWASKWNERAYWSCKKSNIPVHQVQMAVLIQRLVEAEYAFVIHTVNPATGDSTEMYAEIVVGLGETLVGNFPGRALGFSMKKDGSGDPTVHSLPSKSVGLFGGGLIFRSDSNGEDLPGFAGAGLYDSIPMVKNTKKTLMYFNEKLATDRGFADKIMRGVCKVAVDVEKAMGGTPQDIEGCYRDGKFYVVQTRPQV
ncbi:hypothetical protein GUITHDRAFT_72452 [Guillardia theta CCMP2712]|uniref:Uncharacterized protein n=1 Tax=Guillardia theta (strain CCMP2712) TaxID=905079 RepID=L1J6F9_GUITC|nr:hypothetical protein GUITHDRAFT_72452 [Guillardia theta CCMP2712]EKX44106.1 hypothetical protein GUITHDRAFT_72452 [Guillardia theta CCMP2712]|eukprot:XP_005831086.1 hypothetical protein GUITHDRAFT_72452 [Guillardia theta CCMP2712]